MAFCSQSCWSHTASPSAICLQLPGILSPTLKAGSDAFERLRVLGAEVRASRAAHSSWQHYNWLSRMVSKLMLPSIPLHLHCTNTDELLYCLSEGLYRRSNDNLESSVDLFDEQEDLDALTSHSRETRCQLVYKYKLESLSFFSLSSNLLFSLHSKKSSTIYVECVDTDKLVCCNPCVLKIDLSNMCSSSTATVHEMRPFIEVLKKSWVSESVLNLIQGHDVSKVTHVIFVVCRGGLQVHAMPLRIVANDSGVESLSNSTTVVFEDSELVNCQAQLVQRVLKERRPKSQDGGLKNLLYKVVARGRRRSNDYQSGRVLSFVKLHYELIDSNLLLGLTTDGRVIHCDLSDQFQEKFTPLTLGCVSVSVVSAEKQMCHLITTALFVYEIDLHNIRNEGRVQIGAEVLMSLRPETISGSIAVMKRQMSNINRERDELEKMAKQIRFMEIVRDAGEKGLHFFEIRPVVSVDCERSYRLEVVIKLIKNPDVKLWQLINSKRAKFNFVVSVQSTKPKNKNSPESSSTQSYFTSSLPSSMSEHDCLHVCLHKLDKSLLSAPTRLPLQIGLDMELRVESEHCYVDRCSRVAKEQQVSLMDFLKVENCLQSSAKSNSSSKARLRGTDTSWAAFLQHLSKKKLGVAQCVLNQNIKTEDESRYHDKLHDEGTASFSLIVEPRMIAYMTEQRLSNFFSKVHHFITKDDSKDIVLLLSIFDKSIRLEAKLTDEECIHMCFVGNSMEDLIALKRDFLNLKHAFWARESFSTMSKALIKEAHLLREEVLLMEEDDSLETRARLKHLHQEIRDKLASLALR